MAAACPPAAQSSSAPLESFRKWVRGEGGGGEEEIHHDLLHKRFDSSGVNRRSFRSPQVAQGCPKPRSSRLRLASNRLLVPAWPARTAPTHLKSSSSHVWSARTAPSRFRSSVSSTHPPPPFLLLPRLLKRSLSSAVRTLPLTPDPSARPRVSSR